MNLKIKILIGYCILLFLLAFTIYSFRREQVKRNELHREESGLKQIRRMTEEIYTNLLDLASQTEIVISWEEEDFQEYRKKRKVTCSTLQGLKRNMMTMEQQRGVDSLCCLLQEKEQLLHVIVDTFSELEEVSRWIQQKIPIIESTMWNQFLLEPVSSSTEADRQLKRNLFSSLFRKKENKSAYLKQKEEHERNLLGNNSGKKVSSMLRSLNREISQKQGERQKRLFAQMDSLYSNSIRLNHKMNSLAADFEKENNERLASQYKTYIMEREENYCIITGLSLFTSLVAILLYVIVHRELNRINRYQRQLEASNRENTELLQSRKRMMLTIAHDLRSPLAIIRGTAELLPGEQERAMQEEYAGNIRHASDYMLSLVDTLMNFYLLDTGQAWENVSIFHLESLFREIVDSYMPSAKKKELQLLTRFSGMNAIVSCDKGHLQQIVNNLLSNALKFTGKGHVLLEAMFHKGELCIKVQDTGTGMDNNEKKRIFDAFERLDNARNISGFGLGLAITSRLVSQIGGSIRVESRPNEGSCFIVLLPLSLADSSSLKEEPPLPTGYQMEGLRVLLLDDDPRQLSLTREMFRRNRVECDCCTDCRKVVEKLRENDYDVLLTDIRMPDMDGVELLGLLRSSNIERARRIPVIALTAGVEPEAEYLSGGFAGYVRKPFRMEKLMELIYRSVGRDRQRAWRPDFSLILSGEDDRAGMLDVFISESRKDLDRLRKALEKNDRLAVREILHKNLPLWTSVRLDYPAEKLRAIILSEPKLWTEERIKCIREIGEAAERLIACAENMKRNIRQENEMRHL